MSMYLKYDAIVPTSRNPGANHAKLRDFRVVLFGLYFSSSIRVYPFYKRLFTVVASWLWLAGGVQRIKILSGLLKHTFHWVKINFWLPKGLRGQHKVLHDVPLVEQVYYLSLVVSLLFWLSPLDQRRSGLYWVGIRVREGSGQSASGFLLVRTKELFCRVESRG